MNKYLITLLSHLGVHVGHHVKDTKSSNNFIVKGYIKSSSVIDLQLTVFYLKKSLFFVQEIGSFSGNLLFYSSNIFHCHHTLKSYLVHSLVYKEKQSFFSDKWKNGCFSNYKTQVVDVLNVINNVSDTDNLKKRIKTSPKGYRVSYNSYNRNVLTNKKINFSLNWFDFLIQIVYFINKLKIVGLNWNQEWKRINRYWRFYYYFKFYNNFFKWPDAAIIINHSNRDSIITELNRNKIVTIGTLDTNTQGNGITYYIPSNDDSSLTTLFYFRLFINSYKKGYSNNISKFK